ncbi:F-box/FBD/LRR-repeat protein At4g26340-like [Bidens hawaiensis]|uniref:F-box/FBD/LRR-repeat protein At4g26340-like n=1 Tax=Bidens hawaiensis TaxID=980011 RepID=UPI00404A9078
MRLRSAQKKKGRRGPTDTIDYISQMPDDVLVMILSRLLVKDAVVTGSLSPRWKQLWHSLTQLNFDGTEALNKMSGNEIICVIERVKFIYQVNNVITSHNRPTVQLLRIRFDLDCSCSHGIDEWIKFAVDKKVETLELNLLDVSHTRDPDENYNVMLPSLTAMSLSLKKLVLNGVNLNEPTLNEILKNSPHLKTLSMFESGLFPHVRFGGRDIKLKKFKLVACFGVETISLYGFDLESFQHCGCYKMEYRLTDLPKLKKLDIGQVSVGLEDNVFRQISSCALYLQVLILEMWCPQKSVDVNAIVKLPNVKKLMLIMGAEEDESLLEFTSIARTCPRLETFSISLHWFSPMKSRRKIRHVVAPEGHKHLKHVEIIGYYGRISDIELAVYVIDNAATLKKIVIDPSCQAYGDDLTAWDCLKRQRAARSSAKRHLTPLLPPGVDLAIL